MNKMRKGQFDEITVDKNNDVVLYSDVLKVKPPQESDKRKLKYTIYHKTFFKLESWVTKRNIMIASLVSVLFVLFVLPTLKYVVLAFDRHHYGWFSEQEPRIASTTDRKNYYKKNNIPFIDTDQLNKENKINKQLIFDGLPPLYAEKRDKEKELLPLIKHPLNYIHKRFLRGSSRKL